MPPIHAIYLLQTRLVVAHTSTIQISPLAQHLIHYTIESKAPCLNQKGTLRIAERKRKTFIINHHQTCDSDWYSESQNLLYKLSLLPPLNGSLYVAFFMQSN
jgi:hypothetical protein